MTQNIRLHALGALLPCVRPLCWAGRYRADGGTAAEALTDKKLSSELSSHMFMLGRSFSGVEQYDAALRLA